MYRYQALANNDQRYDVPPAPNPLLECPSPLLSLLPPGPGGVLKPMGLDILLNGNPTSAPLLLLTVLERLRVGIKL